MSVKLTYVRVPLSRPYDDCPRIELSAAYSELSGYCVGGLLSGVSSLESFYFTFAAEVRGLVGVLDSDMEVVCCAFSLGQQAISVSHRDVVRGLAPLFGVEFREVRGGVSRNSRLLDVRGPRSRVLSFVQVLTFVLLYYNQYTRRVIKRLGGSRFVKFDWRARFNEEFVSSLCSLLRQEWGVGVGVG